MAAAGYPTAAGAVLGTPTSELASSPVGTPVAYGPARIMDEPLDAAIVTAVRETIRQFFACSNAGNVPALTALLNEDGAAVILGFGVVSFGQGMTGGAPPSPELDPALLDAYVAAIAFPVPVPGQSRVAQFDVLDVRQVEDGRILATTLIEGSDGESDTDGIVLREVGERLEILIGPPGRVVLAATPAAATPLP